MLEPDRSMTRCSSNPQLSTISELHTTDVGTTIYAAPEQKTSCIYTNKVSFMTAVL